MPDLTGTKISNTYKRLMQVKSSDNAGITSSLQTIQSGDNVDSPLQLSNSTLNVNGTFAIGGVNLTATVSSLNATADISGGEGYVVVSGTNVYKRSFSAGNGINITSNDGVASNTGIALTSTISNVQSFGASAVSATTLDVSKTITSSIVSAVDIRGTTVSAVTLKGANATIVSTVSAGFFVGDGSGLTNVPSAEGGTVNAVKAGTGLNATVNGVTSTTVNTSGTLNVDADQSFGTVSVSTGLIVPQGAITFSVPISGTSAVFTGDVSAANVYAGTNVYVGGTAVPTASDVAAVSALTKTNLDSITSVNTVVANVSALTSVNKADIATNVAAITSANTVIAAVSALTSVNKAAITSINSIIGDGGNYATSAELATVSAALATSIGNSNTNIAAVSVLTSVNAAAITSANTVIGAVSVLTKTNLDAITSINTVVGNVSSTLATSIGNSNTAIAAVSVLTSVNLARIVATSAALATSIGTRLPLAGGTITGTVSAQSVYVSALGANTSATLGKRIRVDGAAIADIVSLTDGANISVDFNSGQNFAVQLAGNRTIDNPTNCVPGQTGSIFVIQDGTGSRTLSYGTNYKFPGGTAPTLSTGASACDRIDYITFTSTNIHAVATLNVSTA